MADVATLPPTDPQSCDGDPSTQAVGPIADPVDPVQFLIAAARSNFAAFVAAVHRPTYKHSAFSAKVCRAVDKFVEDVLAGKRPVLMLTAPPQHGKQIACHTPILTQNRGWVQHGDISSGDIVYRPDGGTTRVVAAGASAPNDMRVSFSDGTVIETHSRHEWLLHRTWVRDRTARIFETQAAAERGVWAGVEGRRGARANFQLPDVCALQNPVAVLPVKPYALGVWLGDGKFCDAVITLAGRDEAIARGVEADGYPVTARYRCNEADWQWAFSSLTAALRTADILCAKPYQKRIPDDYFTASYAQRMDLLAGLIDSDGYVYPQNGRVTFSNTDEGLVRDVERLVATFGWRVTTSWFEPYLTTSGIRGRRRVAQVCFQPDVTVPCRVARYREAFRPDAMKRKRSITKIERGDFGWGNCIQVEHPDGMYLVGDKLIPTHNSSLISRCLPPYLFGRLTGELDAVRIACASYALPLARRNTKDANSIMGEPMYREIFPHTSLLGYNGVDNSDGFDVPKGGGLRGVGVKGSLTGFSVECFAPGTLIDTDHGPIRVENLHVYAKTVKVLSYTERGDLEYARIKAVGHRQAAGLYRLTTHTGRVLEVTGNHPIYANGRYIPAAELAPGDVLVCALPDVGHAHGSRLRQTAPTVVVGSALLRQDLHGASQAGRDAELSGLRGADELARIDPLPGLPQGRTCTTFLGLRETSGDTLRHMRQGVCERVEGGGQPVLQPALQKHRALAIDGRGGEPELRGRRGEVRSAAETPQPGDIPLCEAGHVGSGRASVRDMLGGQAVAGTSHRRESDAQFVLQFADPLHCVSSACAPAHGRYYESDTVRLVEVIDGPVTVYDLQVEKNANLFANGVLAHNCAVIDDPTKDAEQALSPVQQDAIEAWYESVLLTRLQQRSGTVIIGTPWSSNDLIARVRRKMQDDSRFTLLSFPALNLPDEIGFNPDLPPGPLVPHLHDETKLRELKKHMSEFWWSAMYQQVPMSEFGAIFKRDRVQYYRRADLPQHFQQVIMSVDATFKDGQASDYVCAGVWGKTSDSTGEKAWLIDWRRDKLAFMATAQAIADLKRKHPRIMRMYIEEAANGAALIDMLKKHFPGIVGVPPMGSKEARAHAVSWAWDNGQVMLPHPDEQPGIVPLVQEITTFPDTTTGHDDAVDMMDIALQQLLLRTPISAMITREILNKVT